MKKENTTYHALLIYLFPHSQSGIGESSWKGRLEIVKSEYFAKENEGFIFGSGRLDSEDTEDDDDE